MHAPNYFHQPLPERDMQIQHAQRRVVDRMLADPEKARSTIVTTGHVARGLACEVQQDRFATSIDLGHAMGGDASAPPPGFFARAAVVSCVAIAIKMGAAREGLHFDAVDVRVETDFHDAAIFGIGSNTAAPLETRLVITVKTKVPETRVGKLVESILEMDPWFLALRDPQKVRTELSVLRA